MVLVGHAVDSTTATAELTAPVPDIAILGSTFADGVSGFDLLRAIPSAQRPVACVVIGARDEDAVAAFELQATDFVLWPTTPTRLRDALSRARQQVLQLALLRTADELRRLLGEANAAGGMVRNRPFAAHATQLATAGIATRPSVAVADRGTPHGETTGRGAGARQRLGAGVAGSGTFVATSPWRAAVRGADARPARGRETAEDAVLDLSREDGGRADSEERPLRVLVREGRRTRFVPLSDVDWFEADGNYIRVHATGAAYRTRGTISAIETALDPRQFVRIHRRVVVNMDRVREMSPLPGGDGLLVLGDGSTLRLSRTYRSRVR